MTHGDSSGSSKLSAAERSLGMHFMLLTSDNYLVPDAAVSASSKQMREGLLSKRFRPHVVLVINPNAPASSLRLTGCYQLAQLSGISAPIIRPAYLGDLNTRATLNDVA